MEQVGKGWVRRYRRERDGGDGGEGKEGLDMVPLKSDDMIPLEG